MRGERVGRVSSLAPAHTGSEGQRWNLNLGWSLSPNPCTWPLPVPCSRVSFGLRGRSADLCGKMEDLFPGFLFCALLTQTLLTPRSFYLRKKWPYNPLRPRVGHITPFLPDSEPFSKNSVWRATMISLQKYSFVQQVTICWL